MCNYCINNTVDKLGYIGKKLGYGRHKNAFIVFVLYPN